MKTSLIVLSWLMLLCISVACEKVDNGNNDDLPVPSPLPPMADPNDVCTSMDDIAFMEYCYDNFDVNHDGKVSQSEAAAVKAISLSDSYVCSLTGIGYFSNLDDLYCQYLKITELDLSNNKSLKTIFCENLDYLKSIDLRCNKRLDNIRFYDCEQLSSVLLPNIEVFEVLEFKNCPSLVKFDIPKTVTNIGSFDFYGCRTLIHVAIPEGVTQIGYCDFQHCENLRQFSFPSSLKNIGDISFSYSGLEAIEIPEGVTGISMFAFLGCDLLNKVILPNTVKFIGYDAFYGCGNLEINLPVGLEEIGTQAFHSSRIEHVIIPESVTFIGENAFTDVGVLELTDWENFVYASAFCLEDCRFDTLVIHDKHFPEFDLDSQLKNYYYGKPILYVHTNLVEKWKEKAGEYFSEILPIESRR